MTETHSEPDPGRAAVIEAAAALLRAGGARAVTTRAVAAAAGVPAPTIYRLFGDKDGLMAAVADRAMVEYSRREAASVYGGGDPVEELRSAWHAHVDFGLANPDLYALLLLPTTTDHASATAAGFEVLTRRVARVAAAGRLQVPVPNAVRMIHAAGSGVVLALLGDPPGARDETLSQATLEAVLGRLISDQPAPRADDHAALVAALTEALPQLPGLSAAERQLLQEWLHRVGNAGA